MTEIFGWALTALNVLVYVGGGVGALLAWKRDKRAAVLMLCGCIVILVAYGIGLSSFLRDGLEEVLPHTTTAVIVISIIGSVLRTLGWSFILLGVFLGVRKSQPPGGYQPQPVPAQAVPGGFNPYAPPPQYGPPQQPPPQYGPPPPQYGPPQPPQPPY